MTDPAPEVDSFDAPVLDEPLPAMDVAGRTGRLRARLEDAGCDALLVTHLTNVRYLTGFTGSAGMLLVSPDELLFVTDGRYAEQAPGQLEAAGVTARVAVSGDGQRGIVAEAASQIGRIGLEADHVSWSASDRYRADWFGGLEVVPTTGVVESLRLVKDEGEVARIRRASAIADAALAEVRPRLEAALTEREFGFELDLAIRRLGAEGNSFETIVASGPNGSRPHHRPSDRHIAVGDLVVLDFGAKVDGYCSDMTRTIMVGGSTPTQQRMLEVVLASQAAGVAAVRAGIEAKAVDAVCRDIIAAAGWADAFAHGTGHGVGLDIHESPRVAATSGDTLAAGHIVTVEPGVYLPGHGGVRIEDTVVVTESGCVPLTLTPKATAVA